LKGDEIGKKKTPNGEDKKEQWGGRGTDLPREKNPTKGEAHELDRVARWARKSKRGGTMVLISH